MKHPNKLLQLLRDNAAADAPRALRADASGADLHVYVYDVIDPWYGASADGLIKALAGAADSTVHLHINSPGGDVFEARAMSAALVAHAGQVVAHIDGVAASAATYLAMAANEVRITDGGMVMVHNSWTIAYGDKTELRATADLLDKIDQSIAADYAKKTGKTLEQMHAWMDAETWFSAAEALDAGLVDAIDPNSKADSKNSAQWNLSAYANAPKPQDPAPDIAALAAAQQQRNRNRLRLLTPV